MSGRIKDVIRQELPAGKFRTTVSLPSGTTVVQSVIDRQLFEIDTDEHKPLFFIRPYVDDVYIGGGAEFGRRKIANNRTQRPGQRMLWSVNVWKLPKPTDELTIEIEAYEPFVCHLDLDCF